MSAVQLLTEHLALWSSADTEKKSGRGRASGNAASVYGIKKLRELILELAVRGKLVPQDENDEPASELLKRIQIEKTELYLSGKIRKSSPLTVILDNEKSFELPVGWIWSRFGDVMINRDGERKPVSSEERSTRKGEYDYYGASGVIDNIDKFLFDKPLLLIGEDGANLLSRSTPIAFIARGKYWVNNHAHVLDGISEDLLRYVELYINAINLEPYVTGTAQPKMNQAKMNSIVIALAPEAEQHRIVAKVDELMALCDQLENQHTDAIVVHEKLVSYLLDTLTQSQDAADFNESWQRIAANFEMLFTTESSIDALKQTLLQLAVMGKLVPQDASDEPASELLTKLLAAKKQLQTDKIYQKTGKLKPKELLQVFPANWVKIQVGEICPSIVPSRDKPKTFTGDIPWITLPSFPTDDWYLDTANIGLGLTSEEAIRYTARIVPEKSVLMSCIGRFGLTAINLIPVIPNQQVHVFIVPNGLVPEFLSIAIRVSGKQMEEMATSTTIAYLNKSNCESIEFGLPPFKEQLRIVAKVDELMILCDMLKTRIIAANRLQQKIADVMVEQAVA